MGGGIGSGESGIGGLAFVIAGRSRMRKRRKRLPDPGVAFQSLRTLGPRSPVPVSGDGNREWGIGNGGLAFVIAAVRAWQNAGSGCRSRRCVPKLAYSRSPVPGPRSPVPVSGDGNREWGVGIGNGGGWRSSSPPFAHGKTPEAVARSRRCVPKLAYFGPRSPVPAAPYAAWATRRERTSPPMSTIRATRPSPRMVAPEMPPMRR